jgi:hypothetical protein
MKTKLTLLFLSLLTLTGFAQSPMLNTNFAWPTNFIDDNYFLLGAKTNTGIGMVPVPFRQVVLTKGNLFSNFTARGWNRFGGANNDTNSFSTTNNLFGGGRITNNLIIGGHIAFANGAFLYDTSRGLTFSDSPGAAINLCLGFAGNNIIAPHAQGVIFKQLASGDTSIPILASRLQVGGMDGIWFTARANSNNTASSIPNVAGWNVTSDAWIEANVSTNNGGGNLIISNFLARGTCTNLKTLYCETGIDASSGTASSSFNLVIATDGVNSSYRRGQLTNIVVGASPFNYTNDESRNVFITIGGGTVSEVHINGTTTDIPGNTSVPLQPNEWVTVTYTLSPTMRMKFF